MRVTNTSRERSQGAHTHNAPFTVTRIYPRSLYFFQTVSDARGRNGVCPHALAVYAPSTCYLWHDGATRPPGWFPRFWRDSPPGGRPFRAPCHLVCRHRRQSKVKHGSRPRRIGRGSCTRALFAKANRSLGCCGRSSRPGGTRFATAARGRFRRCSAAGSPASRSPTRPHRGRRRPVGARVQMQATSRTRRILHS